MVTRIEYLNQRIGEINVKIEGMKDYPIVGALGVYEQTVAEYNQLAKERTWLQDIDRLITVPHSMGEWQEQRERITVHFVFPAMQIPLPLEAPVYDPSGYIPPHAELPKTIRTEERGYYHVYTAVGIDTPAAHVAAQIDVGYLRATSIVSVKKTVEYTNYILDMIYKPETQMFQVDDFVIRRLRSVYAFTERTPFDQDKSMIIDALQSMNGVMIPSPIEDEIHTLLTKALRRNVGHIEWNPFEYAPSPGDESEDA